MHLLGLTRTTTNLRKQKINTEGRVLVLQVTLELGDLFSQHVRCVANTTNDTETTSVGNGSSELGSSSHVHASKHDGVLDLEQISKLRADLLYETSAATHEQVERGHLRGEDILTDLL